MGENPWEVWRNGVLSRGASIRMKISRKDAKNAKVFFASFFPLRLLRLGVSNYFSEQAS